MVLHIGIVGGGIAGLYLAYQLQCQFNNIHIILYEQSSRLGGRIFTKYKNAEQISYEQGAGRFAKNHTRLIKLLTNLGLSGKAIPLTSDKVFIKDGKETVNNEKDIFVRVVDVSRRYTKTQLSHMTFDTLLREAVTPDVADNFTSAFGYDSEFEMNAFMALKSLKQNFINNKYFILSGGFQTIVQSIVDKLDKSRVKIMLNHDVIDADIDKNVLYIKDLKTNATQMKSLDYIAFCVVKPTLQSFSKLIEKDKNLSKTLQHTYLRPLHRIYARFPVDKHGNSWFSGMPKVCTNNALRNIIPINPSKGLIMISYTDGKWAELWASIKNKTTLKRTLMQYVRKTFSKDIPDPIWIDCVLWKNAIHYPEPGYIPYTNSYKNNYIVCGEVVCKSHHAWVEGALRSVDDAMKLFRIKLTSVE